jgi:hypothetical protein
MNNNEAKFILNAYRPDGADAGDPTFEAALAQSRADPALGAWFERAQAFDRSVADKFQEVVPPAGLRESIIAGARLSNAPNPSPWWRRTPLLAMAASIAVLIAVGVGALWTTNRAQAANQTLPEFATDYVAGSFFLSQRGGNLDELRAWLARQDAPLPAEIPAGFSQLRSLGCKTVQYRGRDVSLICFGEGKEYHLFIARRSDFPSIQGGVAPVFQVRRGLAAATWSDEQNHYVVVTDDSLRALKECLDCQNT